MKQSTLIAFLVSMQLLGQLLIQLMLVRVVGVGPDTDAYIASQAVPMVISAIIITALQGVWLPRFSVLTNEVEKWRSEQAVAQGQAAILGGGALLVLGTSVCWWLPLLFPGFSAQQIQDAICFSLIFLVAAGFTVQSSLLTVALRARDRFLASEWIAMLGTVISLVGVYFALPFWGVAAAAWITLCRAVTVYLVQMGLVGWPPLSLVAGWHKRDVWRLMRPLLFGASIYKTSPIVDRSLASQGLSGGITLITLAQTMITAAATVLERSLGVPIIPLLSRLVSDGSYREIRRLYKRFILKIILLMALLVAMLIFFEGVIVFLLYKIFAINHSNAHEVLQLVLFLIGHLFAAVTGGVLVSIFYALGDTKSPVYIGLVGFSFGLILKWMLFTKFAITGLAMASSAYFVLNILLFSIALENKMTNSGKSA